MTFSINQSDLKRTLSMVLVLCGLSSRVIFLIVRWFVVNNDWDCPPSILHYKKLIFPLNKFIPLTQYYNYVRNNGMKSYCDSWHLVYCTHEQTFLWISSLIDWTRCLCKYCLHSSTSNWKEISPLCKIHCLR